MNIVSNVSVGSVDGAQPADRHRAHNCLVCAKRIWRKPSEQLVEESVEMQVYRASALAPGMVCGSCRTGAQPVIAECSVCFEKTALILHSHPQQPVCDHRFCAPCWGAHVELAVRERRADIRCMGVGCAHLLLDADVKRVAPSFHAEYVQLRFAEYQDRLRDVFLAADAFGEWARRNTQACPRCHILVQRSEGCVLRERACHPPLAKALTSPRLTSWKHADTTTTSYSACRCNHMTCRCGHQFCYKCGKSYKVRAACRCATVACACSLLSGGSASRR